MTKLRLLLGSCAVLLLVGAVGSAAVAAPPTSYACSNGPITGTYDGNLTVTSNCTFSGTVTINGNLTVAPGVHLNDHAGAHATVVVNGNVSVGAGGVLGLGSYGPSNGSTVNGNIVANKPLSLYISKVTIHGNLISNGGGSASEFRNFPTKDNVIDGNLIVQGWQGGWIGALGNTVGGNLIFSGNASVVVCTEEGMFGCAASAPGMDPDSSEVASNAVSGNLICINNTPAAQLGDADVSEGGVRGPNTVSGNAIGECAGLTAASG